MVKKEYKLNATSSDTIETRISISGDSPVSYCNARYSDTNGNKIYIDRYGSPTYAHVTQSSNKFMIKLRNFSTDWSNPYVAIHVWKNADYGSPLVNDNWSYSNTFDVTLYFDYVPVQKTASYLETLDKLDQWSSAHYIPNSGDKLNL